MNRSHAARRCAGSGNRGHGRRVGSGAGCDKSSAGVHVIGQGSAVVEAHWSRRANAVDRQQHLRNRYRRPGEGGCGRGCQITARGRRSHDDRSGERGDRPRVVRVVGRIGRCHRVGFPTGRALVASEQE